MICIPLTKGQHAIIDEVDWPLVSQFKWHALFDRKGSRFYAQTNFPTENGKYRCILLHRLIMRINDPLVKIDHHDSDGLNNVRENLRICSHAENMRNVKRRINNTSGFKGVQFEKAAGKWRADISINEERKFLGYYTLPEIAHAAYCDAAKRFHGDFANFGHGSVA